MSKIEFLLQVIAVMSLVSSWSLYQIQHYLREVTEQHG